MGVLCSDDKVGRFWHQQLTDPGHITNFADTNYECGNHVEVVITSPSAKAVRFFLAAPSPKAPDIPIPESTAKEHSGLGSHASQDWGRVEGVCFIHALSLLYAQKSLSPYHFLKM